MATRTSRRGGVGTAAPTPTVSSPRARPPSPLSPTRASRIDEKRQMQVLNNRLAHYIETVQSRDVEIGSLKQERSSVEEVHTSEVTQVKTMYNKELESIRNALDGVSRDKAKFEIEADKFKREATEVRSELSSKSKRLSAAERDLAGKTNRLADAESRLVDLEEEVRRLRPENAKLASQLQDAKRNLEDETLRSTDLQNQLITQQEGLKFENSMLEQQLSETRVRKQMEVSEMDGRLSDEYDKKLHRSLDELRNSYEKQLEQNRDEFSRVYDDKLSKLQSKLDGERVERAGSAQELRELATRVTVLTSRNVELESSNSALQRRVDQLAADLDGKDAKFRAEMARKDAEVRSKDEQIEEMLKDYKDLMEIKVALDIEIAAYRKMLDLEEARLGLSMSGEEEDGTPTTRGVKRRRTYVEEEDVVEMVSDHTGLGNVQIEPVEKGGKCVRLTNRTGAELNIGGWSLTNHSGGQQSAYKFPRSTTLQPDGTCTVWSSDATAEGAEHSPPNSLVMKKGGWVIGATNKTTLVSKEGEEEASRLSREERRQASAYRAGRAGLRAQEEKQCGIM